MHLTLVNLLGVPMVAFWVPFTLGFFPRVRIPSVTLELVAGIILGPAVLGWIEPGPRRLPDPTVTFGTPLPSRNVESLEGETRDALPRLVPFA
jgi:Kef-type K+ transport system membrane component KefB